jgi:catechol 2,3-dioxygenase-like lactoylglutathione lyase family enzyme
MRIGLVSIFADDQDRAEQFYTQVLDLQVKTNAPYGPDERWLTVVSPEEPDGVFEDTCGNPLNLHQD